MSIGLPCQPLGISVRPSIGLCCVSLAARGGSKYHTTQMQLATAAMMDREIELRANEYGEGTTKPVSCQTRSHSPGWDNPSAGSRYLYRGWGMHCGQPRTLEVVISTRENVLAQHCASSSGACPVA
jgi:hypothetical protein